MSIEDQVRSVDKDELEDLLVDLEKRLKEYYVDENIKLKSQILDLTRLLEDIKANSENLTGRIEKIEENLGIKIGPIVKLRKYTLDQLMSEYKRLTGNMRPEEKEEDENLTL